MLKLKSRLDSLKQKLDKENMEVFKLIKDYLFLFSYSDITGTYKFKYSENSSEFGGKIWHVNIYYNPVSTTLNIDTGTKTPKPYHSIDTYDTIPDVNKIRTAFIKVCASKIDECENRLSNAREAQKLLKQLEKGS